MNSESQSNQIRVVSKSEYSRARRRVFRLKSWLTVLIVLALSTVFGAIYTVIVEGPEARRHNYSMMVFLTCMISAEVLLPLLLFAFFLKKQARKAQIELSSIEAVDQGLEGVPEDQVLVRASLRADDDQKDVLLRGGSGVAPESCEQLLRSGSPPNEEN